MATPATCLRIGTPASMSARVLAHTEAIEDEPLDSNVSLIRRMVYGKSSSAGRTGTNARSAR